MLKIEIQDTGLDIGSHDVPGHVKINADKFTLE